MLGLGKWKFRIDTMFYRGDAFLTICDVDGAYDIKIDVPGQAVPKVVFDNMQQEGDTLTGAAITDLFKGKAIPFSMTFSGDQANGFLKIPMFGKLKLNNGVKLAD